MTAHTILLTFEAPSLDVQDEDVCRFVIAEVEKNLQPLGLEIRSSCDQNQKLGLVIFSATDSDAVLRVHRGGLITLDLHEFVDKGSAAKFTEQIVSKLENDIKADLKASHSKSLPSVRRGEEVDVYYPTVDGRFVEYDIRSVLHHSHSQFQDILIVQSETLGNILILDGDINMGESDVVYSHTLMQKGALDYTGKTCLVLGGGDGGLLNELLKEKPQMVTMVDIDEEVLTAVRSHLRGVCGDSLDSRRGENYEVIVGDALELLKTYVSEGRQFDFVLYDLTSVPVTPDEAVGEWEFCKTTHSLAVKVLAPGGFYLGQVHAALAKTSVEKFEEFLRDFETPLEWKHHKAFIPSFSEVWVFFQIWKREDKAEETA